MKTGINRDKGHLKERMDQGNVRNGCQPEVTSISGDDSLESSRDVLGPGLGTDLETYIPD